MRHTVIGLFDTYTQAEAARDKLVEIGFARSGIELQANPEPPPAADVDPATARDTGHTSFMANIEHFFSSLFASGPRPEDSVRYTEAVRRGAVLVCVRAASESHAELAHRTLSAMDAKEIGERPPSWDAPMAQTTGARDHSALDELGIGSVAAVPPMMQPGYAPVPSAARPMHDPDAPAAAVPPGAARQPPDPLDAIDPMRIEPRDQYPVYETPAASDPAARAVTSRAMPRSGAYFSPPAEGGGMGAPIPDEFLEYEEDFRGHYDQQLAKEGARYEDYSGAYHYGAKIGQDVRYRDRTWDDVEPEARRDWEATPNGDTWERFKAAIRHGWDRVTGHHHV